MSRVLHFVLALAVVALLALLVSSDRKKIRIRFVVQLLVIEVLLAWFFLNSDVGLGFVKGFSEMFEKLLGFANEGTNFVFGKMNDQGLARIEDLRAAAEVAKGRKVAPGVQALVVPGSGPVKAQAEAEGLDKIFIEAGFEWRLPGCSMCLAMNNDRLNPGERCASTSNRNFEGRQGRGGRTHLVSPAMAAAAAVTGHFADIRSL